MAWEQWHDSEVEVYNNGYYRLSVMWGYRVNPVTSQGEQRIYNWMIQKVSSSVTGWWKNECPVGIGTKYASGYNAMGTASVDTRSGSKVTITSLGTLTDTYYYDSLTGNLSTSEIDIIQYCKPDVNTTGSPEQGWYLKNVTSLVAQSIDRKSPTIEVALSSKTYKSLTVNVKSNYDCDVVQYRLNDGEWVDIDGSLTANTNKTITINDLTPNTSYKVEFNARRSYNEIYGQGEITETTNKPNAPTAGNIKIIETTVSSISISYSGFGIGDLASLSEYKIACYIDSANYISNGINTSYTFNNLEPNTKYNISVMVIDNYGQTAVATTTATTLEEQATLYVKYKKQWRKGKVLAKKEGWKKAIDIYDKKNGIWVKKD